MLELRLGSFWAPDIPIDSSLDLAFRHVKTCQSTFGSVMINLNIHP